MDNDTESMYCLYEKKMKQMGPMSSDAKNKCMGDGKDKMKMKGDRDREFEDHDFSQRIKMGYFNKMTDKERGAYDKKDDSLRKERKGNMEKFDEKMGGFKFDSKKCEDDDTRKKCMSMTMMQ